MNKLFFSNLRRPFLIAELSSNHNGSIIKAKQLIRMAKKYDADAVKLQTFTPDTMTINSIKKDFRIKDGLWKGHTLWNLYQKAQTPIEWHKELFDYSKKIGIKCFSSAFDEISVDLLEKLKTPLYKVASFEMTDIPLIKKIAKTKKPMIISTGLSNLEEIKRVYNTAKNNGCKEIVLLYCVSSYPAKDSDINLNNIKILKEIFNCKVGFSDHTNNPEITNAAISAGAEIIEKHIALQNQNKGFDVKFSLKGKQVKEYIDELDKISLLMGKKFFYRSKSESKSSEHRRSIYAIQDIKKNEKFTKLNLKIIRPGKGIQPVYFKDLMNKKSPKKIKKGTPLNNKVLKDLKI